MKSIETKLDQVIELLKRTDAVPVQSPVNIGDRSIEKLRLVPVRFLYFSLFAFL